MAARLLGSPSLRFFAAALSVSMLLASLPARAGENCLTDEELHTLVRSVYTRSIGRVLHICGDSYSRLDGLALNAANDFFTAYAEEMRDNRTAANAIMMRFAGSEYQEELDGMLDQATAGDEMWAHLASDADCHAEIIRIGRSAQDHNYAAAMETPRASEQYKDERARVPACEAKPEASPPGASDAKR